ncbi:hypothetical protein CC86DRAFT_357872 [Ophiobolus disseminans]|uniref:Uncharacterized protein n=1 Tax=Ophiobolus disseminans TaxID=1469910 RepID=A0A6A6ZLH3_9PLEO|nr:hypothetical protein CC86DRAFT_357872 [Ophiobolus disseminans]
MAPSTPVLASPILPSRDQIALAIAINRSKPLDITIREYVLQLREHWKVAQPAYDVDEIEHYIDLVGYWQDQCKKAQEECDRLQSINIKLERSNHLLSQRTGGTPDERPSTATNTTKRKAPAPPSRSPKRPKAQSFKTAEQSVAHTQEAIESDFDFLEELGEDGTSVIEALYTTHQLCRATAPDPEVLCRHLVRTSSSLAKVIRFVAHNHAHLSRHGRSNSGPRALGEDWTDFAQALTISARGFMSVLVGITRMMDATHDDRLPSLVICELAEMFNTVLSAIESSAHQTAETARSTPAPLKKGKAKATPAVVKESMPARSLAHFLIGLLGLLDKTNGIHQKIFDAFVFLLLERVGKRLHYCTFGRHRSANIEDNLAPPPEPTNEIDKAKCDTNALGTRLEVKALVLILERAMGLAPHHMNPPNTKAPKSPISNCLARTISMKTLPAAPKGRLSAIAKDRLQRTLVACMYGSSSDDEFLDVLTKPIPAMRVGNLQNVGKIQDEDVEQWYKEEVWRLVGWDIMARESGL